MRKNVALWLLGVLVLLGAASGIAFLKPKPTFAATCEAKGGWLDRHACKTSEHKVLRVSGKTENWVNTEHCEQVCVLPSSP